MNVHIRRMLAEDVPAVALIDCMSMALPWSPRAYINEIMTPHSRCYVAETRLEVALDYHPPLPTEVKPFIREAGQPVVVGMLIMWLILDEAHIATLAVHPQVRRLGAARRLLETALREAVEAGAHSSLLEVRAGNLAAQTLYRNFGFEEVGRRPHYYKDNCEDAVLMTLSKLDLAIHKE